MLDFESCSCNLQCKNTGCCIIFDIELFPDDFLRYPNIHVEDDGITMKRAGDRCPYLNASNLCMIYDHRPNECRQYDCCGDERIQI